jgi:hypothetical protein
MNQQDQLTFISIIIPVPNKKRSNRMSWLSPSLALSPGENKGDCIRSLVYFSYSEDHLDYAV